MNYFIADTHFNHKNIIKYDDRPFSSVEEMNETMIQLWNSRVTQNDNVYILGDVGFGNVDNILRRLNGNKYLIRGNHDKFLEKESFDKSLFVWIKDIERIQYKK